MNEESVISGSEEVSVSMTSTEGQSNHSSSGTISLARNETKAVKWSKALVLLVLVVAAAACGTATHHYSNVEEENDFKEQFADFAGEVVDSSQHKARSIVRSAKSTSTTITSIFEELNWTWPLLTVPHFEIRGMQVNELSTALVTGFSPIVSLSERTNWEMYSVENQEWINEGIDYRLKKNVTKESVSAAPITEKLFRLEDGQAVLEDNEGPYLPVWQLSPAPYDTSIINYNMLSHPVLAGLFRGMLREGQLVLSQIFSHGFFYSGSGNENVTHPHSVIFQPVYGNFEGDRKNLAIKGVVFALLPWINYFNEILPEDIVGVIVVLTDTCGDAFTYRMDGARAIYVGEGDLHEYKYDDYMVTAPFAPFNSLNVSDREGSCDFFLNIYPSKELESKYRTKNPVWYTTVVILVFICTTMVFVMYDFIVQRRQDEVMATAKRSNAIVSSLFPSNVRDRIMKDAEEHVDTELNGKKSGFRISSKSKLKDFLGSGVNGYQDDHGVHDSKPIADLFPAATVMFADIVGFTAWSSVREPSQVFQLLESLFHAFDEIAKARRVFKVETVGDCYVAVAGLPDPRKDHAIVMARFARDCLGKVNDMTKKLEVSLGPDTGDLSLRVGLHSGPVTAGVLRGDKSRFQLFGDTVNTASRMGSNGARNKIHISQETADLLTAGGKSHWMRPRKDKIVAKGKGELQTYWLDVSIQSSPSSLSGSSATSGTDPKKSASPIHQDSKLQVAHEDNVPQEDQENIRQDSQEKKPILTDKVERLVHWNADVLRRLLQQVVARRTATHKHRSMEHKASSLKPIEVDEYKDQTVLDEVKEIITLPKFDAKAAKKQENAENIQLSQAVTTQLHDYVTVIATMYRDNPFHNFEHASHVTMSVVKLLSRIVAPEEILQDVDDDKQLGRTLHDHTYGITSDPLTQFAVVFSALIHDVDHTGVPNAQLVKEKTSIAAIYKNKSVAEQNSVDIAWDLLMDSSFDDLRAVIYSNNTELKRFRQLVVNTVMATDIVDKELKELRNARWDKAFHQGSMTERSLSEKESRDDVNRKATIVIEHLIQASDVAHTMQHWHIYRKWNERFFQEMLNAYKAGRAEKDPAEFWYKGEIGFFDFYIIPLAKKLKDCGVFGVSSDEYLNYAMTNRKEWELKGQAVVAEMIEKYKDEKKFTYDGEQCKLGEHEKAEEKRTFVRTEC